MEEEGGKLLELSVGDPSLLILQLVSKALDLGLAEASYLNKAGVNRVT